jgi:hypothetical protein
MGAWPIFTLQGGMNAYKEYLKFGNYYQFIYNFWQPAADRLKR